MSSDRVLRPRSSPSVTPAKVSKASSSASSSSSSATKKKTLKSSPSKSNDDDASPMIVDSTPRTNNDDPFTSEYALFGIENPLLDISAHVDEALLAKYGLKANDAILVNEQQKGIYADLINNYKVEYVAGGAAQNTLRGAQWLLPPKSTVYVGCVGADAEANQLREAAAADGLRTEYMVDESTATGRCGVLITGHHRSLCTDLLAANNYKISHLKSPAIWSLVESAKYFYIGSYFLTVSPDSAQAIAEHVSHHRSLNVPESRKKFCLNLSAPFIPQFFKAPLDALIPHVDFVFGNEAEAVSYAESHGIASQDVAEIAQAIADLPRTGGDTHFSRTVVFTQGRDPTLVAVSGGTKVQSFPVHAVPESQIIDTNGAGDAFCGGFLAGLVRGESIEKCVAAGQYVAAVVIQRSGPTYPRNAADFTF